MEHVHQPNNLMEIRLNTNEHLDNIKGFLSGQEKQEYNVVHEGRTITKSEWKKTGERMMNESGLQSIMMKVSSIIHPSVVQGNIEGWNDLREFICYFRQDLNDSLMVNLYNWDIQLHNYDFIIDFIVDKTRLFLSRLVLNKERESYNQTFTTHEISRTEGPEAKNKWIPPVFK